MQRASHARPKMPVTTRTGPAAIRGVTLGLCPVRRHRRDAVLVVGCGGATSSYWDMAGTGSVLQMSPLQIPASLQVVTNAPARLWNSPGVQQCHKVSPAPREPPAPLQCARSFGAGIIEGAHRY